jgi:hypothetical protein
MTEYLVTDYERKFVLGVATSQDLEVGLYFVRISDYLTSDPSSFYNRHSSHGVALSLFVSGLYHHFCWSDYLVMSKVWGDPMSQ